MPGMVYHPSKYIKQQPMKQVKKEWKDEKRARVKIRD
jgi:hypothetical protein